MYDNTDDLMAAFIILLFMFLIIALVTLFVQLRPEPAAVGLTQEWKCDKSMTMIVDIPDDGMGPVEGFHCERVGKGEE